MRVCVAKEFTGLIDADTIQTTGNKAKKINISASRYLPKIPN
jgi:hypothetical protein